MKRKIISIILVAVMTISCSTVANAAEKNTVSVEKSSIEFDDVWQEYKNDEQFNLMLKEYGKECAESFIWDVIAHREEEQEFENNKTRGGGGNTCYQYVTNRDLQLWTDNSSTDIVRNVSCSKCTRIE